MREKGFSIAGLPLENAEQGPSRNEVHEDVDVSLIHAGAKVADHISVSHTSQDLYLQPQLLILLGYWGGHYRQRQTFSLRATLVLASRHTE